MKLPFSPPTLTPLHHMHVNILCKYVFWLTVSCSHLISLTEGVDYVPATREVQFQMAPDIMCHLFTILRDTEKEPVEIFGVLLETSDPAVQLIDTLAIVSINDSTGISTMLFVWLVIVFSLLPVWDRSIFLVFSVKKNK